MDNHEVDIMYGLIDISLIGIIFLQYIYICIFIWYIFLYILLYMYNVCIYIYAHICIMYTYGSIVYSHILTKYLQILTKTDFSKKASFFTLFYACGRLFSRKWDFGTRIFTKYSKIFLNIYEYCHLLTKSVTSLKRLVFFGLNRSACGAPVQP